MSIKVIGFDFDGVIVDTTGVKSQCFLELFRNAPKFEEIQKYESQNQARPRSEKISEILLHILHEKDLSRHKTLLEKYQNLLAQKLIQAQTIKGVQEFLIEVEKRKIPCFIISSAPLEEIKQLLKHHRIEKHFCAVYDYRTPKTQAIKKIIEENKIKPTEMIFFGDQLSDLRAAQESHCQFAAINPATQFPKGVVEFKDFTSFDLKLLQ